MLPRPRFSWGPVILVGAVVGCGGDPSLTDPAVRLALGCGLEAPAEIGIPSLLPPDADCLSLGTTPGSYAIAFFDTRIVESARHAPEASLSDPGELAVTVRTGAGGAAVPSLRIDEGRPSWFRDRVVRLSTAAGEGEAADPERSDDESGARPPAECRVDRGYEIFCRERPWQVGDTLTIPAPFGLFIDEVPRSAEILVVRGPFAFAVPRDLPEASRYELRALLARLAHVGRVRVLPFVRRALVDRPVHTSPGSGQILVDTHFDLDPVCVCGVAVGHVTGGTPVAGISIRIPAGPEFEPDRTGLFAHELAHVWQHAHATERAAGADGPAPTRWALEGGADFVRQEVLRGLAEEPIDRNRDARAPVSDPYLDRLLRSLGVASGRIRNGYGQSAGLLRHFFVRTLASGGDYDAALQAVLLGSLEGWFAGSPGGDGLAGRLTPLWPRFDPTTSVLEYAIANAIDDRTGSPELQNPAVLEAWRESTGSRFVPAARLGGSGSVSLERPAGSVGYVYVEHPGGGPPLRFGANVDGVRWMAVRFQ